MQESCCIFSGIPIMRYAYLAMIALTTVFSMVWYKIVMNALSWYTMEYPACHLYFLGLHTHLKVCVYSEKIQVTSGILFHSIPLESVA